ncbi:hypothetical protein [Clostridium rectalis]|uniref:hypothetical protein n=1 Tax=Clostridium rectalis TaxID=2040295 RepID=UPI000F63508F|nr:hypothetical protein [Clostridium rectalis]
MRLAELKMIVAENCEGYEPMASVFISDIGSNITDSCENCYNFKDGKCIKNLFDPIKEKIYRN